MNKATEVLMSAKELIQKGFTKDVIARDSMGAATHSGDPNAVCWCSVGAINKAVRDHEAAYCLVGTRPVNTVAYDLAQAHCPLHSNGRRMELDEFNDSAWTTQADVVALFDAAIADSLALDEGVPANG